MIAGQEAENLFFKELQRRCKDVRFSTKEENILGQYDIVADGIKYDVKATKKLHRGNDFGSDVFWIEFYNVLGNRGWVKGEADYIAFMKGKQFLIVGREELYQLVKTLVTDLTIYRTKSYCKLYRRKGRKDVLTYI